MPTTDRTNAANGAGTGIPGSLAPFAFARHGRQFLITTVEQTLSANVCFFASHAGHSQPT